MRTPGGFFYPGVSKLRIMIKLQVTAVNLKIQPTAVSRLLLVHCCQPTVSATATEPLTALPWCGDTATILR